MNTVTSKGIPINRAIAFPLWSGRAVLASKAQDRASVMCVKEAQPGSGNMANGRLCKGRLLKWLWQASMSQESSLASGLMGRLMQTNEPSGEA